MTTTMLLWSFLGLVLLVVPTARSDLFTSLSDLELIMHAETSIANDLRGYVAKERQRLEELKRVAEEFERHSSQAFTDVEAHLSNPVNQFMLIKRFTRDWGNIVDKLVRGNNSKNFIGGLSEQKLTLPTYDDLNGACESIFRVQNTYDVSATELARGQIKGVSDQIQLSAGDCFLIGAYAYRTKDYYHTVMWMMEALDIWEKETVKTASKVDILDHLSFSTSMQGNTQHALNLTNEWLSIEPNNGRALSNKRFYQDMLEKEDEELRRTRTHRVPFQNERPLENYFNSKEFLNYEKMCRGDFERDTSQDHKLFCRYRSWHPIHVLNPLREEIVHINPYMGVYHNLITDSEMETVRRLAGPKMARATTHNRATGRYEIATYRISKSAWLRDEEDIKLKRVSIKSAVVANLTLETVEQLQASNYGIGGHYELHYDFSTSQSSKFDESEGNRVATIIYYMTDVKVGGCTVFPDLGVRLVPEKGACGLWYNMYRNGQGDMRTKHAACPVMVGNKWVLNKWFHERGQEFIRPCALDPNL